MLTFIIVLRSRAAPRRTYEVQAAAATGSEACTQAEDAWGGNARWHAISYRVAKS